MVAVAVVMVLAGAHLHPVLDRLPPGLVDVAVVGRDHGDGLQPELRRREAYGQRCTLARVAS